MIPFLNYVTLAGDLVVLLPVAVGLAITLYASSNRQGALYLLLSLVGCLATMGALKLFFLSCGGGLGLGITSPSGHAAASALVFGSICVIVCVQIRGIARIALVAVTVAIVVAIALSRVALGAHSSIEVVIGIVIGTLFLAGFGTAFVRLPRRPIHLGLPTCGICVAFVALHGHHLPIEELLRHSATLMSNNSTSCF